MTQPRLIKHNPILLTEEELLNNFVVRLPELQLLCKIIGENTGPANQHVIIIAPRGMGKTMLVRRLALAVRQDETMNLNWHPLVLPEDIYTVANEGEFWLHALERIAVQERDAGRDYERWLQRHAALFSERNEQKLRAQSLAALTEFAAEQKKKLIIIVENMQMLMGEQTSSDSAWDLRRTLLNNLEIMLITTATTHFQEIINVEKANYELFREIILKPISTEESRILWRSVSGEELTADRIRPMEILAGGSPRLLAILANFAAGKSLVRLMDDLVELIDDHTTYFKANIEALPVLERRVFATLAEIWEPAEARQVSERCRLDVNVTSALLKKLVRKSAVAECGKIGRKNLYQVAERLYNIYHLLRLSGIEAERVKSLVRFMAPLYGESYLAGALAMEACHLEGERRQSLIEGYREILSLSRPGEIRERIINETPAAFFRLREAAEIGSSLALDVLEGAIEDFTKRNFLSALDRIERCIALFDHPGTSNMHIIALALLLKCFTLNVMGRLDEAVASYDEVLRRFGDAQETDLLIQVARALDGKGVALRNMGRLDEAVASYDEVLRRFGDAQETDLLIQVARALDGKGVALRNMGRLDEALASYDEVLRRFGDAHDDALRKQVAVALNGKAWIIYIQRDMPRLDQALLDMERAMEIMPVNNYRHTMACLLGLAGRWDEAFSQAVLFADDEDLLKNRPEEIIAFFVEAAAAEQGPGALRAITGTKTEKAMEPLVVALKMLTERTFRAPREVVEVAGDVVKRIKERARSLQEAMPAK